MDGCLDTGDLQKTTQSRSRSKNSQISIGEERRGEMASRTGTLASEVVGIHARTPVGGMEQSGCPQNAEAGRWHVVLPSSSNPPSFPVPGEDKGRLAKGGGPNSGGPNRRTERRG